MSFKVYRGPMPLPNCVILECEKKLCDWMSDRYCFDHSIYSVKLHDINEAILERLEKIERERKNTK